MEEQKYKTANYLTQMKKYFEGDFNTFKEICKEIEIKEKASFSGNITGNNNGKQSDMYITHSNDSSNNQTTLNSNTPLNITDSSNSISSSMSENLYLTNPIEIVPEKQPEFFRITLPITLSMFAVIDIVGWLVGTYERNGKRDVYTNENYESFFKYHALNYRNSIKVNDKEIELLNCLFRQGAVHRYFPKERLGVTYHSTNESKPLFIIEKDSNIDLSLNVNRLYKIVSEVLNHLEKNCYREIKNERLGTLIKDNYNEEDKIKVANYIKPIKKQIY